MAGAAAIVLAAGRGRRFGASDEDSKLTATFEERPLVRHVVDTALVARLAPVIVVTGQAAAKVEAVLSGLPVEIVRNETYAAGLAGSLRLGLAAVPKEAEAALVLLADMPLVRAETLDRLVVHWAAEPTVEAVVPTFEGRWGNPVLLARRLFAEVSTLDGDEGARRLLVGPDRRVAVCPVEDRGIEIDIDTREALGALTGR